MSAVAGDAERPASASAEPQQPALSEVMLAMDVVDTLRHREGVALRELEQEGRDDLLKERLRDIYEDQGLVVSDRILEEGIRALRDSRFTYQPTPPSFSRTLAGLWVKRKVIGTALAAVVLLAAVWIGWSFWEQSRAERAAEAARVEITETLPRQLEQVSAAALSAAESEEARRRIELLQAEASLALSRSDAEAARVALDALERLRSDLLQTYEVRIVSRPGEDSGIYRIPDVNTGARNYYLIVEAITPDGERLALPVRNEETGATEVVSKWAVRVPEAIYEAVRRDKLEDGIVQNDIVATKPRGVLEPAYTMDVSGGAITEW